jgi:tRNA G18 (ribose-2'-O)-methylase SpoU
VKIERIDDPRDPRIAAYSDGVRDPVRLRGTGSFLGEGRAIVQELLAQPARFPIVSLVASEATLEALDPQLATARPDLCVYVATPALLRGMSGVSFHQGCVALVRVPDEPSLEALLADARAAAAPIVVLERVSDPDNVGSVFRNAFAFGAGAVVLSPGCASPLYRKALRTSLGAALRVPFATAAAWPQVLAEIAVAGFTRLGLSPAPGGEDLDALDVSRPVALLLGSEGDGLTPGALRACDRVARIAMREGADSVNVATASGIALHHLRSIGSS